MPVKKFGKDYATPLRWMNALTSALAGGHTLEDAVAIADQVLILLEQRMPAKKGKDEAETA